MCFGCLQLVHGKPFEDMHVPNVSADMTFEDFMSMPNSVESPDSLACLLPQAVHDVVSELANKLLRCEQCHSLLEAIPCIILIQQPQLVLLLLPRQIQRMKTSY